MTAQEIINRYISFFEKRGHKRITNAPLVPENDPTTLFTSSGMQPLVPYLLGEPHPMGKRLVNVQNSFRAQDIDEVGDNRHTTFFRMLGNWSLGEYSNTQQMKENQLFLFFKFLIDKEKGLGLNPKNLYVTVFEGDENFNIIENGKSQALTPDIEAVGIWKWLFKDQGIEAKVANDDNNPPDINNGRIFYYSADKNWWSRAGTPEEMPIGEPGGPDSEVFYDFGEELQIHENSFHKDKKCHPNCECGRFLEIGNSVFMQYRKINDKILEELPNKNVDFGGGLERLLAAVENQNDIFQTSLFGSIVQTIELQTKKSYQQCAKEMRIIADHFVASVFIIANNIIPSNKEQGYILRRLIRRALDNFYKLKGKDISPILEAIINQYGKTDNYLIEKFEEIKNIILEEEQKYKQTLKTAKKFIEGKYKRTGDDLMGITEISSEDAFILYATHGLSPTQIKSLGLIFNDQEFAEKMKAHQDISRAGAGQKFKGGLADHSEKTIMGHTATHLLHQALRDVLGDHVFQSGSNITSERVRFDFNFERNLNPEELNRVEDLVNEKIKENLPVYFEIMSLKKAKEIGAIGLFNDRYSENVKVYFIDNYSKEFCGGPHVDFTSKVKRFKIFKQENIGKGYRRIYAKVG